MQLVLLPYVFPEWHAGSGLMIGGDWTSHHRLAVQLAETIRAHGWGKWVLRPEGQAPAGIAGALYALTVPKPWILIPLHAALYATAGLILLRIIQFFVPKWHTAIWAVLPFLLYPSAMLWYTQILKDGYSIVGCLLFFYGWMVLARLDTWKGTWWVPLLAVLWITAGILLIWIVRPFMLQIIQYISIPMALFLTGVFLFRCRRTVLKWRTAIVASLLFWVLVLILTPVTTFSGGGRLIRVSVPSTGNVREVSDTTWTPSTWLPGIVDNMLHALAKVREDFCKFSPGAESNIDVEISFQSAFDVIRYVPRALQIVFAAPFPMDWFKLGTLGTTTFFRRISGLEMCGVYFALVLLPYAVWRWRRKPELWVIVGFCVGLMVAYGLVAANIGTLYRMRYGFIMTLVALSMAGGLSIYQRIRARSKASISRGEENQARDDSQSLT